MEHSPDSDPTLPKPAAPFQPAPPEREHEGSIWKHPYMIYILITAVLFVFLVVAGTLALNGTWLPQR